MGFEKVHCIMAQTRLGTEPSLGTDSANAHSLESWCAYDWRNGVHIPTLEALDRLIVRTCNHIYDIIVLEPSCAEVMVRGGQYFPEFTRARVGGASLGGGFQKLHGIYTGFCLELHSEAQAIVTSPVREITPGTDRAAA
jgi:hypothetical protein